MSDRPAPLVPPVVDLRGYEFMPFYGHHLLGSTFHAQSSDAAWRAGVTLWWAAWNQVPAASLPNDDKALCRLADLGRDLRTWKRVKDEALHGFVECSDGRLYHQFLAPHAIEAWERRVAEQDRKRRWRQGKERPGDGDGDVPATGTGHPQGTPPGRGQDADVPSERRGEERTETGKVKPKAAAAPPDWLPLKAWAAYQEMRRKIKKPMTQEAERLAFRKLESLRIAGHAPQDVLEQSTFNSWQGLFEVKANFYGKQSSLEAKNRAAAANFVPPEDVVTP